MSALTAAVFGSFIGFGLFLVILGIRGAKVLPDARDLVPAGVRPDVALLLAAGGLMTGVVVYVGTGWPVAAVACGALVFFLPKLLGGNKESEAEVARTQAIASWAEMIRDNMAGAAGLEQALAATVVVAPTPIAPELQRFAGRLDRTTLGDALAGLGDDLNHPAGDLIIVSLANATRMEARELGPLLSRLAASIREDVRMRLRIEVGRTRIRTSARVVVATTVFTIVFLFLFSRKLLEAYDSFTGQLWMCVVAATFCGGGLLMRHYSRLDMPDRFRARRHVVASMGGAE